MAFRTGFIFTLICLLLVAAVNGQASNDTRVFRVGDTATLACTGVTYDGLSQHWEKNPATPAKYLVVIQSPLGGGSPSAPFVYEANMAAADLTGRFTVTNDLMTATITGLRETDDGDYRCNSGSSEIVHTLVTYKLNSVGIEPSGPVKETLGGTFDVTCTADSKPAASFNWTKQEDSSFTATGATLRISDLTMNHTGTYVCTAYHAYASDTASVQLTVSEEPTVAPTSQGQTGGPNDGSNAPQTGGANVGGIVGGVIGALAGVGVMAAVVFFVVRKKRADRGEKDGVESGNDEVTYHAAGHPGAPENMSRPPPNQPEVMYAELDLKNAPAGSRKPYVATPDDSPTEYAQIRPSKPPRSTVPHTLAPDDKTEYASIAKPKPNKRY